MSQTYRLICPTTGMVRGLVRLRRPSGPEWLGKPWPPTHWLGRPWPVTAETPILDWLTAGEDGSYPYICRKQGDQFDVEGHELSSTGLR
jgi:hypothetical protein